MARVYYGAKVFRSGAIRCLPCRAKVVFPQTTHLVLVFTPERGRVIDAQSGAVQHACGIHRVFWCPECNELPDQVLTRRNYRRKKGRFSRIRHVCSRCGTQLKQKELGW